MLGCTNPAATNYNPAATEEDHSCLYSIPDKVGVARKFRDYQALEDTSFTLSYSIEGKGWVFFHDYIPDFYFHTREQLWTAKNKFIYKHNSGSPGRYYGETKPFFVDMVFKSDSNLLLETVNWITETLSPSVDNSSVESEWETITHISIWNSQQHSGRIALNKLSYLQAPTNRKTKGEWSFNDFRNVLAQRGTQFLMSLFNDYALIQGAVAEKGWYDRELLEDKYFVIRFETDNISGKQVILHQTNIQALKSDR